MRLKDHTGGNAYNTYIYTHKSFFNMYDMCNIFVCYYDTKPLLCNSYDYNLGYNHNSYMCLLCMRHTQKLFYEFSKIIMHVKNLHINILICMYVCVCVCVRYMRYACVGGMIK